MAGPLAAMMMGLGKSRNWSKTAWMWRTLSGTGTGQGQTWLFVTIMEWSFFGCIGWMVADRLTPAQ